MLKKTSKSYLDPKTQETLQIPNRDISTDTMLYSASITTELGYSIDGLNSSQTMEN